MLETDIIQAGACIDRHQPGGDGVQLGNTQSGFGLLNPGVAILSRSDKTV